MATVIYPSPIFGPIHSRRLGISLGINLLPSDGKFCTFDCIYCECGYNKDHRPTRKLPTREEVREALESRLKKMQEEGVIPNVLTFAGNGEPTAHPHFPEIIEDTLELRNKYFPDAKVSVLSNSTFIHKPEVFAALNKVDNKDGKCDAAYITLLKNLAKMGYTSVEAANYNNGKFYDRTPDQFKKDVESAGLKVLSSHCTRGLSKEELASGDFSSSLQWWDQCIADHKAAGMSYIVAPWMDVPKTLKELDTYCAYYNEIGKRCKQQGMSFGYHNHAHEFQKVEDKVMYDYMIEHTNPEYVFFQMDVYWVVRGQNSPVDYFNKYPGRFKMFHIKDHREIGQSGMVGFDAIFKNAKTAGVKHLVAEIESYSMPVEKSVEVSLDYLLDAPFVKSSYAK